MARFELLDVRGLERRYRSAGRALSLDHEPQLRRPAGTRRADAHHEPADGRGCRPHRRAHRRSNAGLKSTRNMDAFTTLTAIAAPLEIAKIDTGMIVPGRFQRLRRRPGHTDYADVFLHDLRFDDNDRPRADFVLNDPAYRGAKILVTGPDFGCGSSRESAAYAVLDSGARALIGPSFGDVFVGNCMQNGVLPIVLALEVVQS